MIVDFEQPFQRISIVDELEKNGIYYDKILEAHNEYGMQGLPQFFDVLTS